jgi:very-short-patch-repair endonuclease
VFRGTEAVRRSELSRQQLRSAAWFRVCHDVYADARLERDHLLACRAALARLPAGTVLAGPSAAYAHGVDHAASFADVVHVIPAEGTRLNALRGIQAHHTSLHPTEIGVGPGLSRTTGTRTAWDVARWMDVLDAVAVVDTLLARGLTSAPALTALVGRYAGRPGWRRAQTVFGLADPGAQSPQESRLRVRLVQGGLPRPTAQLPVRLRSGIVLHPDLAWEQWRVAVEYDGHWHADPDQLHRDRRRLNQLVAEGWIVLHVTSRRMGGEFPAVLREIRDALISRGWRP